MRIQSITLRNVKSHRDTEIAFSAGINVLCGPNGVGKSTVFEAIGYALFGVDASEFVTKAERFLSIGEKRGEIAVVFRDGSGDTWKVTRGVGQPAKWLLWKETDGVFEVEEHAGAGETEARLAELLGLGNGRRLSEQFRLVIGPFQNEFLGPFIIKQPTKRQETFDEILGIDAWRKTYKGTSSLLAAVQERVKVLAAEITLLAEQAAALPAKREELAGHQAVLASKRQELADQAAVLRELETALGDLDAKERSIATLRTDIAKLEERVKGGREKTGEQALLVEGARQAKAVVDASRAGKDAYDKADARLATLRGREKERRVLEKTVAAREKEAERLQQSLSLKKEEVERIERELKEEAEKLAASRLALQPDEATRLLAVQLGELRKEEEKVKADRALLEGRKGGFEEGREKLSAGRCPFFQEECLNVSGHTPDVFFAGKIDELDMLMAELGSRALALEQKINAAEAAEKDLAVRAARLKELDRQALALEGKVQANGRRAHDLTALAEECNAAVRRVAEERRALEAFTNLDEEIRTAEKERQSYLEARERFTANCAVAGELEERVRKLESWQKALEEIMATVTARQGELAALLEGYQAETHRELKERKEKLLVAVATLRQQVADAEKEQTRMLGDIGKLEAIEKNLKGKQSELDGYREKERLVKFLRDKVFRNVSAQLSERFREEISQRADRIYRVIAESDEELHWGDNYQIVLKDLHNGSVRERSDDQLSGGQVMSAVVALRLALLQTIGAQVAFFDEPTSNLDASRRENLARAFRAIDHGREEVTEHWYEQLFLISHDVSFTEITDQVIDLAGPPSVPPIL